MILVTFQGNIYASRSRNNVLHQTKAMARLRNHGNGSARLQVGAGTGGLSVDCDPETHSDAGWSANFRL